MTVAGDEFSSPVMDDGEGAEAVVLEFEDPLRVVEGRRSTRERHRLECHRYSVSGAIAKVGRISERTTFNPVTGVYTHNRIMSEIGDFASVSGSNMAIDETGEGRVAGQPDGIRG